MEKKPYCKITWNDSCELDYSETICEVSNLTNEIDAFIASAEATTEQSIIDGEIPSFSVEVIMLTETEYNEAVSNYER